MFKRYILIKMKYIYIVKKRYEKSLFRYNFRENICISIWFVLE